MLARHLSFMALQLVDSSLPTTRRFWRITCGYTHMADDPRPLAECLRAANDASFEISKSALRCALNDDR